jgi:hypothetical protein
MLEKMGYMFPDAGHVNLGLVALPILCTISLSFLPSAIVPSDSASRGRTSSVL